jgi:hypothetical protein
MEILAPSTERRDRGEKLRIYQDEIGAREYYWYHPDTGERAGFVERNGRYEPLAVDADGRMTSPLLGLTLVIWHGEYQGRDTRWLRWADANGVLLPTRAEAERARAEAERARAEAERARAEAERARADRAQRELEEARALLARYREQTDEDQQN